MLEIPAVSQASVQLMTTDLQDSFATVRRAENYSRWAWNTWFYLKAGARRNEERRQMSIFQYKLMVCSHGLTQPLCPLLLRTSYSQDTLHPRTDIDKRAHRTFQVNSHKSVRIAPILFQCVPFGRLSGKANRFIFRIARTHTILSLRTDGSDFRLNRRAHQEHRHKHEDRNNDSLHHVPIQPEKSLCAKHPAALRIIVRLMDIILPSRKFAC